MNTEQYESLKEKVETATKLKKEIFELSFFNKDRWFRITSNDNGVIVISYTGPNNETVNKILNPEQSCNFLVSVIGSLVTQQLDTLNKELEAL
jgi:hypothetical protein